jgi:hypothetical protein
MGCALSPGFFVASFGHAGGRDKPVALLGQGFDESRISRRISKHVPDSIDAVVQAVVEVDEGLIGPQEKPQLFAGYKLACMLQQYY